MIIKQLDNIERLYMHLRRCENIYKDKIAFNNLSLKEKKLLESNKKYKGLYKGKRCFIVGNGPSVNKIDFGMLEKELVITVNEMFRHQDFSKLNSNFHFIADPAYMKLRKMNKEEAEIIERINELAVNDTTLFLPVEAINAVRQYGWQKKLKINYFASNLFFYDDYREAIDFTKYVPAFQAVIQWGIAFAVYMGCNEIYLLGCDATNIVADLSLFVNQNADFDYAYNLSEKASEHIGKKRRSYGLEYTLYGYWRIVHLFSELFRYCGRNNVKLYNCSMESILECIPKKTICPEMFN